MNKVLTSAVGASLLLGLTVTLQADNGPAHRVRQARPISLGTSGGNVRDRTNLFCCSGTLGALVKNSAGTQFILSNNHVMALSNNGAVGDDQIQPGMIDQVPACAAPAADRVADLSAFITIVKNRSANNQADAAVAQVVSGTVKTNGDILDIGCLTGSRAATIGLPVKKSGRTSGFTTGTVQSVNVTILVGYPNNCGSFSGKTARFINQIRVTPGSFLLGGDSGSLMVENAADGQTHAVGLLFAGSSSDAFANPIGFVLSNMPGGPYSMVTCTGFEGDVPPVEDEESWDPQLLDAIAVQEAYTDELMQIRGVIGTGVGMSETEEGRYVIEVYVRDEDPSLKDTVPESIEDLDVRMVKTGRVFAY